MDALTDMVELISLALRDVRRFSTTGLQLQGRQSERGKLGIETDLSPSAESISEKSGS